jgi:RNA polymerase sigma-70 factor (ECF subfamily)
LTKELEHNFVELLEQHQKIVTKELEHNFVELLEQHQNIVHKVCRLYTNNQDAHNDLFQEITIQLWKAYPKFRGESKFSTWMYRVGLNTAITLYRKSKRTIDTQDFDGVQFKITAEKYDDTEEQHLPWMRRSTFWTCEGRLAAAP